MKRLKNKGLLSLLFVAFAFFVAGCGSTDEGGDSADKSGEKPKISLLIRDRGDLSYWDSMADGGDRAKEDFADVADIKIIETSIDVPANLDAMYAEAEAGADLIITSGDFNDNIVQVGEEFPDIGFVVIGEDMSDEGVYSIDFKTSEASFLAGIAASDISSSGLEGTSGENTIGFIGGMDETLVIQEFLLGYLQGAKYFNEDTNVVMNYVGDWNDPDSARTQALTQYNDAKADVILGAAGSSANGVHSAASTTGKYTIGVDTNQREMYKADEEIASRFATSVVKEIGNAVYSAIEEFLDNDLELDYDTYKPLGLDEDAVSIVVDDQFDAYLSDEAKEKIEEAREAIASGEIEVIGALGKSQDEIQELIKEYTK